MPADLSAAYIGAVAVVIASIIGLIVAVTTAVIAKEQKVSEFRQAWINDFRKESAELYTLMLESNHNIFNAYRIQLTSEEFAQAGKNPPKTNEMLAIYNAKFTEATKVVSLIRFRLNPERDRDYINNMHNILKDMGNYEGFETVDELRTLYGEIQVRIHDTAKQTHKILKGEWERVKQGEKKHIMFVSVGEFLGATFIIAFYIILALVKLPELAHYLA